MTTAVLAVVVLAMSPTSLFGTHACKGSDGEMGAVHPM